MLRQRYYRLALSLVMIALLQLPAAFNAQAQEKPAEPEFSVAGVKLGHRASAKAFLIQYLPTTGEDGRPAYYFYNKFGSQVMKLTAASFEDPYFITEIEVFSVGKSYQKGHHWAEKIGYFMTEKDIFIGYRQSMTAAMIGIPNLARGSRIGPKDVVKKKGMPTERVKDGERETVTYSLSNVEIADEDAANKTNRYDYYARYEFNENKLKRFTLKISPAKENERKF
jgi:hypothetical protein